MNYYKVFYTALLTGLILAMLFAHLSEGIFLGVWSVMATFRAWGQHIVSRPEGRLDMLTRHTLQRVYRVLWNLGQ